MDRRRKHAYRFLLYWGMIDIRNLGWNVGGMRDWVFPIRLIRARRQWIVAGDLANWLHNLALFSANDFTGFEEAWFWQGLERLLSRHPDFGLDRYRDIFERRLRLPNVGWDSPNIFKTD